MRTRVEKYLAKLDGEQIDLPAPITREETFLAKLAGMDVEVPTPVTRLEQFLNMLINRAALTLTPITREEIFIAQNAGYAADSLMPVTREEQYWYDIFNHGGIASYETVTGKIVSFLTQRIAPLKIEADLEPIQDLHGQDAPYPPGGGGQLLNKDADTVGAIITSTGGINTVAFTDISITEWIPVEPNTTYTQSGCGNVNSYASKRGAEYESKDVSTFVKSIEGQTGNGTFTTGANTHYIRMNVMVASSGTAMLNKGSTALPWQPYFNICPISGHTGADIFVEDEYDAQADPTVTITFPALGKNKLPNNLTFTSGIRGDDGSQSASTASHYSKALPVEPSTEYTLQGAKYVSGQETVNYRVYFLDENKGWIRRTDTITTESYTFTTPSNCHYLQIQCANQLDLSTDAQLELGSSATAIVPYTNTVYGGKLTVNEDGTGTVVASKAYALLNDQSLWYVPQSTSANFAYDVVFSNAKNTGNSYSGMICSYVPVAYGAEPYGRWLGATNHKFGIKWESGTLADIKQAASDGKIAICYELAEPVTIALTPGEVDALQGQNVVWVDDSDNITVRFRIDKNGTAMLPYTGQGKAGYMTI